ncbi:uncharacterized protein [Argopecten irradians]|uniref:uncharacterized protein isoform X2 n=1 Tax=Argopecten irradians TaxID=31199 RepID=UPI00371DD63F
MDRLDKELDDWLKKSPSKDEMEEGLKMMQKKRDYTFHESKSFRDMERDEVTNLEQRLKLLRGEVTKPTEGSSAGKSPLEKLVKSLELKRSVVLGEIVEWKKKKEGSNNRNYALKKEESVLLTDIMKEVFEFVSEERKSQISEIMELLHMGDGDQNATNDLQQSLGYDIEKALLKTFYDTIWKEKICKRDDLEISPYLEKVNDGDYAMGEFVYACIQLVWYMLLETPPLAFSWEVSKINYRYHYGKDGDFISDNNRIVIPAIVCSIRGDHALMMKGILQFEQTITEEAKRIKIIE